MKTTDQSDLSCACESVMNGTERTSRRRQFLANFSERAARRRLAPTRAVRAALVLADQHEHRPRDRERACAIAHHAPTVASSAPGPGGRRSAANDSLRRRSVRRAQFDELVLSFFSTIS